MAQRFNTDGGIHEIPLSNTSGQLFLCGKHFIAPNVEHVRHTHNIDTVVCLVEEHELAGRYDRYIDWHRNDAKDNGVWFPIHDLSFPVLDSAIPLIDNISRRLQKSENVLVHCAAGIGRAGTTATAVLMKFGMDMNVAQQHVRQHRPMAGPESGAQMEFIQQFDKYIRDSKPSMKRLT